MTLSKDRQQAVKAGLEALASLEQCMKIFEQHKISELSKKNALRNMKGLCKLIEEIMYCKEEELEKKYDEWETEMSDRCDMFIGQSIMALEELKHNKVKK